jgi:hypothetical protein
MFEVLLDSHVKSFALKTKLIFVKFALNTSASSSVCISLKKRWILDSAVSIEPRLRARWFGVQIAAGARSSFSKRFRIGFGAHPVSYSVCTWDFCMEQIGRGVMLSNHLHLTRRLRIDGAIRHLPNLLSSRLLSKNTKSRVYRTVVVSVVLDGCETWFLKLRRNKDRGFSRIGR